MDKDKVIIEIKRSRKEHKRKVCGDFTPNASNKATLPGVLSSRGCAYAGARGVVFGPITDVANIVHGPIGCSYYSWNQRRNLADNLVLIKKGFSTDLKEKDIVFGGEKKLYKTIIDVYNKYSPRAIAVYSTCPVGLIGDDIDAVCKKAEKEIGCPIIPVHTEGFKGVSQSKGHKAACDALIKYVVGTIEPDIVTEYDVNIVGEYNIGGDAWELKRLFTELGLRVHAIFTGNSKYKELASSHKVKLNMVHCQRSITSLAKDMQVKFGIPYIDIAMFGITQTSETLLNVAEFFGLRSNAEALIEKEMKEIEDEYKYYKNKFSGKRVALYIGGARSWHFIKLYEDLGMEVILAGTEFGHKIDYEKMGKHANEGTILIDDLNHYELCDLLNSHNIDLFGSGIKEMHTVKSKGIPYMNLHSYGGGGPYVGYKGFINFAKDVDKAFALEDPDIKVPIWERGSN